MSADGLMGSRSVVPDLSVCPAMEVENEEFLIPNSLRDINSSPREGTVRWGTNLIQGGEILGESGIPGDKVIGG